MITVHHLNQSRSKRVLWLLEELNMPYELVLHQRDSKTHLAPASLKAVHPLSKAPVIVEGDIALCESGAIVEYVLDQDKQNALRPLLNSSEYYSYLQWCHFAEGSLALPVITKMFMQMEKREGGQPMDGYIGKEIELDLAYIENTLSESDYFTGGIFSAADIMMTITLEMAGNIGLLAGRDKTQAYLVRMQSREAYKKAAAHG